MAVGGRSPVDRGFGWRPHAMRPELAERIGVMVSSIVALFLVSPLLRVPALELPLVALGSPLHLHLSRELTVGVVAGALAWVGAGAVLMASPAYEPGARIYSHRLLPVLAAVAATVFWQRQTGASIESRLITGVAIGLALSLIVSGQYGAMASDSPWILRLRTALSIISLSAALYLWIIVYGTRARSLVTAPAAALLAGALGVDLLQYEAVAEWRLWRAVVAIGLIVGSVPGLSIIGG